MLVESRCCLIVLGRKATEKFFGLLDSYPRKPSALILKTVAKVSLSDSDQNGV